MMKHNVLSGILLMLQEWEEWQLHNRGAQMHRRTSEAWRKGLTGILWSATRGIAVMQSVYHMVHE